MAVMIQHMVPAEISGVIFKLAMRGDLHHSMNPFYAALLLVVLFVALSLWRFERKEF